MAFRDIPIQRKLMAALLLTSGTVLLLSCSAFIVYEVVTLRKGMMDAYLTRAKIIAANSTASLAFQNSDDAAQVLGALKTDPRVTASCLYDSQGKVFAKYPVDAPAGLFPAAHGNSGYRGASLEIFCPIVQGDRNLGTVYIQSNLSELSERFHAYAWLAAVIVAASVLTAYLLSRALQGQISTPILDLALTAKAVSKNRDFSIRAQKFGEDELGSLTDAFNQMLSEIQAQNQALRRSEERFRALIENSADGIAVANAQGEVTYVSPSMGRMFGLTMEDFSGKIRKDMVHPDDLPYVLEKMSETLGNPGKTVQARYRIQHKDGSWRWIDMTATNLLENPAVGGIVRNIRDITEQLKLEEINRLGESKAIATIKDCAILMMDPEGKILTWNRGAELIKGYGAEEIIGKNFELFYTPEEVKRGKPRRLLQEAAAKGQVEDEGERIRKGGSRFLADVVITALKDDRGQLRGFIKIARDVTEIRRAQAEIKQTSDFLGAVLENIPNMIFVKDAKDLRFVNFNKAGEELLGLRREDLMGKNDYDFFPKEQADFFASKDREVIHGGKLLDIPEETIETKSQGTRLLHTRKIPIRDKDGKPLYLLGISEDITDAKRQRELEMYAQALEVSNRELQDFVFVASHDLQEPLRKIQSFGEFLAEEYGASLEGNGKDYLERMRSAASRMQTLINDLLTLTRVTTKAKPFEPVELSQVLKDVLSDLEVRVAEKKAKVELGPLPKIEADATQMRQLFQNLVGNALKFQKPGAPPEVRVEAEVVEGPRPGEKQCRVRVQDNGIGFDNKYAEQIFKVFERLHGRDEYEGTGIGLAVCRKVAERHGGTITARGTPGQGSVFTVTLPVRQNPKGGNA